MSRTFRKEYRGAKKISKACRNHGSCPYCQRNRMFRKKKEDEMSNQKHFDVQI